MLLFYKVRGEDATLANLHLDNNDEGPREYKFKLVSDVFSIESMLQSKWCYQSFSLSLSLVCVCVSVALSLSLCLYIFVTGLQSYRLRRLITCSAAFDARRLGSSRLSSGKYS